MPMPAVSAATIESVFVKPFSIAKSETSAPHIYNHAAANILTDIFAIRICDAS
ncbi:hypothetical protein CEV31_2077 [Brucella thiophenivorans]|uniref:Uncharacterized protein n=1 Tax=Brucella thiophenivorans TaxID=571255 RepID=A0A256FV98_9HYPH|nr:hypothetical protein CEV31_2077 [Brucella thiophenivorans]